MIYNNSNEILEQIRKIMKTNNITMNELARRLNKSQPATSGLFRMKNISYEKLKEITDALDCQLDININYTPDKEIKKNE